MEFVFYSVIFVVALTVFANLVQTVMHPPVEISAAEIPRPVQKELDRLFPSFVTSTIMFLKSKRRYIIQGTTDHHPGRIEFELLPDGKIDEIDFNDISCSTAMQNRTRIPIANIPTRVAETLNPLCDGNHSQIAGGRSNSGMIGSENAFEIKFRTVDFQYEFQVTETGRLVEFEKKRIHRQIRINGHLSKSLAGIGESSGPF